VPIAQALTDFRASVAQCDSLIANAHTADWAGTAIFSAIDRQQITVAAFLNLFMAWESYLETTLGDFMTGAATLNGGVPIRHVMPPDLATARGIVVGTMRFFDYANHHFVIKMINIYFHNGYPYEPHLSSVFSDLEDLRAMRNASAHISSTTQTALEGLAMRIFGAPRPGIGLYDLLTSTDPRPPGGNTVFVTFKNKLLVTADLIANG
jgi:hypothetical protein